MEALPLRFQTYGAFTLADLVVQSLTLLCSSWRGTHCRAAV